MLLLLYKDVATPHVCIVKKDDKEEEEEEPAASAAGGGGRSNHLVEILLQALRNDATLWTEYIMKSLTQATTTRRQ